MLALVKFLKLAGAAMEFFLGIPFLGGLFIVSMGWSPLGFMIVYYVAVLILAIMAGAPKWGPGVGFVVSILAFIPFFGMFLHWLACICLLVDGMTNNRSINAMAEILSGDIEGMIKNTAHCGAFLFSKQTIIYY